MRTWLRGALVASVCVLLPSAASAGPYADDLSKCMVKATSDTDKTLLMKWVIAAGSKHPDVASIVSMTDAQRTDVSKSMAHLVERLLTVACKTEAAQAIKYEGALAFQSSFQVLGQVAGTGLFSDPSVSGFMTDFTSYLDAAKLTAALGIKP